MAAPRGGPAGVNMHAAGLRPSVSIPLLTAWLGADGFFVVPRFSSAAPRHGLESAAVFMASATGMEISSTPILQVAIHLVRFPRPLGSVTEVRNLPYTSWVYALLVKPSGALRSAGDDQLIPLQVDINVILAQPQEGRHADEVYCHPQPVSSTGLNVHSVPSAGVPVALSAR